jgi:tetratricopeptide (TPR) repeat protein
LAVAAGEVVPEAGQVQNSHSGEILRGVKFPNLRLISFCLFRYTSGGLISVSKRNLRYHSQMVLLYSWYFCEVTPRPKESAIRYLQVQVMFHLGEAYYALGDYRRALTFLRSNVRSLEGELLLERFGMVGPPSVFSRNHLAMCLMELGAFPEGIALAEEAVKIAEAVSHSYILAAAYRAAGVVYLRKGDLPEAISRLERGLQVCRAGNILRYFSPVASALGAAYGLSGGVAETLPVLEQAMIWSALAHQYFSPFLWVSEAYLLTGRVEEAMTVALRALEHSRAHKERGHEAWALRLLAEIHAHRVPPEVEPAGKYYRQAVSLANELEMPPLQAHCHRGLGLLYAKIGGREEAGVDLSAGIALYRAMEMTFWLPQTEAALAEMEGR